MAEILDALGTSVLMLVLAWTFILVPSTAALAYRCGISPATGMACACIPIPFGGWLAVVLLSRREGSTRPGAPAPLTPEEDPKDRWAEDDDLSGYAGL